MSVLLSSKTVDHLSHLVSNSNRNPKFTDVCVYLLSELYMIFAQKCNNTITPSLPIFAYIYRPNFARYLREKYVPDFSFFEGGGQ